MTQNYCEGQHKDPNEDDFLKEVSLNTWNVLEMDIKVWHKSLSTKIRNILFLLISLSSCFSFLFHLTNNKIRVERERGVDLHDILPSSRHPLILKTSSSCLDERIKQHHHDPFLPWDVILVLDPFSSSCFSFSVQLMFLSCIHYSLSSNSTGISWSTSESGGGREKSKDQDHLLLFLRQRGVKESKTSQEKEKAKEVMRMMMMGMEHIF